MLTGWRVGFFVEGLGRRDTPALRAACREEVTRYQASGELWVLTHEERPVSCFNFNARLPDVVQIGGVWTPPGLRGRGYARAVVAGALELERQAGVKRALLFTDPENRAAQAAYEAIGFHLIGDCGLVLLE